VKRWGTCYECQRKRTVNESNVCWECRKASNASREAIFLDIAIAMAAILFIFSLVAGLRHWDPRYQRAVPTELR